MEQILPGFLILPHRLLTNVIHWRGGAGHRRGEWVERRRRLPDERQVGKGTAAANGFRPFAHPKLAPVPTRIPR